MKKIKSIISITLMFSLMFCFQLTALADGETATYSTIPTEGIPSPYPDFGQDYHYREVPPNRNNSLSGTTAKEPGYLGVWGCEIGKSSSTRLKGYGESVASNYVDIVGFTLTFQKWENGRWANLKTFEYERFNYMKADNYFFLDAKPGYYYRTTSVNYVKDMGISDYKSAVSNYIFFN
ncbi:hypothetical protein [Xylanivirga thermophila]|jgi:hypothetical protein|uniref:hypothetical protein n=1 Tax=Xylanivirga thermophila TaxID=2496273 RepID=UPI00101C7414|nr:hypothetical protein [Xylanivirga thermophila]